MINLNIVQEFCRIIKYIDESRDFELKDLKNISIQYFRENPEIVANHWRDRTKVSKYPLLRKFWRENINKAEFGELDPLRVAYRERVKERMRLRKITKFTDEEVFEKMETLRNEMDIASVLARLTLLREKLKLISLEQRFGCEESLKNVEVNKKELLDEVRAIVQRAEVLESNYTHVPVQSAMVTNKVPNETNPQKDFDMPSSINVKSGLCKNIDNDISFFLSSVIATLSQYGFEMNDFKVSNVKILNEKIRKIKKENNPGTAAIERVFSFDKELFTKLNSKENSCKTLVRALSYSNPNDQYIDKISPTLRTDQDSLYCNDNFVNDSLVKRTIDYFRSNYSSFKCGYGSNYQQSYIAGATNSSFIESLKIKKYESLMESLHLTEVDICQGDIDSNPDSYIDNGSDNCSLLKVAQSDLSALNLESRFRSFMIAKRVK